MPQPDDLSMNQLLRNGSTQAGAGLPFSPRQRLLSGVTLIVVLTCVAYWPAMRGGFILDDDLLLTSNDLIKSPQGLSRIWFTSEAPDYWPLTNTSLWLEWRVWGMNSTGYRVTNLLLHIAAALLIWTILQKLSVPGAFLAALLFAVHPVNVESVAWIAQRKGLLAMLFFLLSVLCYLKADLESLAEEHHPYRSNLGRWYWLSLLAFVLAMLSKGSVAILPLVLLLICGWQRRRVSIAELARLAPFFLVALVLTGVNIWYQTYAAEETVRSASFAERLIGAGAAVWFYLSKALAPIHLMFVYPKWHVQTSDLLWWLPLMGAVAVTVVLAQKCKSPTATWARPLLFAWGFFCVALAPVLGFTDVGFMKYSLVADHYQHIALIGVVALVASAWSAWYDRTQGATQSAAAVTAVFVVCALALLTCRQSRVFGDAIVLYQTTLERNRDCWIAQSKLGDALFKHGRQQEAIEHLEQALRLAPNNADAHDDLGVALAMAGRVPEAIAQFEQTLQLKPGYAVAHNNLGNALNDSGRPQEAIDHYQQAVRLKPDFTLAYANLATVYAAMHRSQEAVASAQKALDLARSQGQTALAERIADWLTNYRSQQAGPQNVSPQSSSSNSPP